MRVGEGGEGGSEGGSESGVRVRVSVGWVRVGSVWGQCGVSVWGVSVGHLVVQKSDAAREAEDEEEGMLALVPNVQS